MSLYKDSEVLSLLQPDLLTMEELIVKIQSRCRIKNLGLMSKEGLVELFRRVILPLPQRSYRTNRRGKMLASRRAKTAREIRRKDEGVSRESPRTTSSEASSRLKPPPEVTNSRKTRTNEERTRESNSSLIQDKRKSNENEERKDAKIPRSNSPSRRKITLKRPSADENASHKGTSPTDRKMQRTAIKWP